MKYLRSLFRYLAEAKTELTKVVWLSPKETIGHTLTIILVVAAGMMIVSILDYFLTFLLKFTITKGL